ncbi:MAG: hypothetical protein ACXV8G_16445, partial [Acidimicrobiales bacterium]
RWRAVAAPMPELAPVTTAVVPRGIIGPTLPVPRRRVANPTSAVAGDRWASSARDRLGGRHRYGAGCS